MILTVTLNPAIDKIYTVEGLTPGEVVRVGSCDCTAGGKGVNVSKAAARAGESVIATGFLGGRSGEFIGDTLRTAGIRDEFIRVPGETRTNINVIDSVSGKITEILEPGSAVDELNIQDMTARYSKLINECDVVAISGSVPAGVPDDIYFRLINIAHEKGRKVILDSSGALLEKGIVACPDVIKPNITELQALTGQPVITDADLLSAALQLHMKGIGIVIVSMGKNGALYVSREGIFHGKSPDVEMVNTIGCGDTLVAATAISLSRNLPAEDMVRLGIAMATANVLMKEPGLYSGTDLSHILGLVQVQKLG